MYIWLTLFVVLILDRLSKMIIQANLELGQSIPVIPGFFHITYILNPGAAFGMLKGETWFFILTSMLVLGVIIFFQYKVPKEEKLMRICLGMIAGGAIGNLIDRLLSGKVIDFLDFKIWSYIFNIADSMIVVGGIIFVFLIYRSEREEA